MLGNKGKGNETEEVNVAAQVNTSDEHSSEDDDESIDIQRRSIQLYI
jgi:hypothetical protein